LVFLFRAAVTVRAGFVGIRGQLWSASHGHIPSAGSVRLFVEVGQDDGASFRLFVRVSFDQGTSAESVRELFEFVQGHVVSWGLPIGFSRGHSVALGLIFNISDDQGTSADCVRMLFDVVQHHTVGTEIFGLFFDCFHDEKR
jgi:hypothetical protein